MQYNGAILYALRTVSSIGWVLVDISAVLEQGSGLADVELDGDFYVGSKTVLD